jgi:F0F1-type ATP synthase beta subunit
MHIEKEASPYGIVLSASSTVISAKAVAFVSEVLYQSPTTYSLVVSLHKDYLSNLTLRALLLTPASHVTVGAKVIGTGKPVFLVLGDFTIAALLDPLGSYIHTTMRMNSPLSSSYYRWSNAYYLDYRITSSFNNI